MPDDIPSTKRELRAAMRSLRSEFAGDPELPSRSSLVVQRLLEALPERFDGVPSRSPSRSPSRPPLVGRPPLLRVLAYRAMPGEVDVESFVDACRRAGVEVVSPAAQRTAAAPCSPTWPDVVLVPGLAFDARGGRLGQGAGWYDRFLGNPTRRGVAIGVGFAEQMVAAVPMEPHDIQLDCIVTDDATWWA